MRMRKKNFAYGDRSYSVFDWRELYEDRVDGEEEFIIKRNYPFVTGIRNVVVSGYQGNRALHFTSKSVDFYKSNAAFIKS